MFLTADELCTLTGYRQPKRQRSWLEANNIHFKVAGSGRPLISTRDLGVPDQPAPEAWHDPVTEPWYAEGLTLHEWREREWERLYVPATELWARRIPRWDAMGTIGSGVYFLYDRDGSLLYVGLSVSIGARIKAHLMAIRIPFTHASWIEMPPLVMESIESEYIRTLLPPWNVRGIR